MKIAVITPISHLNGIKDIIESKGEVFYLENNPDKSTVKSLLIRKNIDTIICNPNQQSFKIDKELLHMTNVKLINTCSTGMNHIDVEYCSENEIEIYSLTKDYNLINNLPSTSELAFGLMVSLLRKIPHSQTHVSEFKWDYTKFVGTQIKDLKIGIIGYGRLGKMMKSFCDAFNAKVFVYDPYEISIGCEDLEEMIEQCDVISLHVHVTDETKYMINKKLLSKCKPNLCIINTSRGEIVNEIDIVNALKSKTISGYATDVIEHEFDNLTKSPIIKAMNSGENIIITPHVGGMTLEGQSKAYEWAINKL